MKKKILVIAVLLPVVAVSGIIALSTSVPQRDVTWIALKAILCAALVFQLLL